jgi:hypothetical protein
MTAAVWSVQRKVYSGREQAGKLPVMRNKRGGRLPAYRQVPEGNILALGQGPDERFQRRDGRRNGWGGGGQEPGRGKVPGNRLASRCSGNRAARATSCRE